MTTAPGSDKADSDLACPAFTVVYVEDDRASVMLLQCLFSRRPHYTLHHAADGRSALELCKRLRPDLLLADMHLPDMSGMELLQALRRDPVTHTVPCVALSADAMPDHVNRARACGFDDYWTKPIDVWHFLQQLDRQLQSNASVAA